MDKKYSALDFILESSLDTFSFKILSSLLPFLKNDLITEDDVM